MATTTQLILETIVKGTASARSQIDQVGKSVDGVSKTASIAGKLLAGAFAGFSIANITKSFMSFEDQLAGVSKTTGLQSASLQKFGKEMLEYSTKTRSSIDELLTISQIGGQLGIAGKDIGSFTKAIDKLNVALGDEFSGGVEQVTKGVSGLRLIFKDMQTDDISSDLLHIGNALNVLGASGSATGEVITEFSNRMGGVLAPLGATTGQILGLSATLQELQVAPERGASAVTRAVQTMGTDLEKFADIAGVSTKKFTDLYNKDVMSAFALVTAQVKNSSASNAEFIKTLDEAGLDGVFTAEVVGKLGSNMDLLSQRIQEATSSLNDQSSIQSEFDKMNSTMAASTDKLWNSLKVLGINLVGSFAEPLTKAIDAITSAIQTMIGWGDDIKEFFDNWEKKSTLTKAAVVALGGALSGVATAGVVSLTAALWRMVPAALAAMAPLLPWIIGGALVAGLVAGLIWLWNNWDKVMQWIGGATDKAIGWVTNLFGDMRDWITTKIDNVAKFIRNTWNGIVEFFASLPGRILGFVSNIVTNIVQWFLSLPEKIWTGLTDSMGGLNNWINNIGNTIREGIGNIGKRAWEWGKNLVSNFIDGITSIPGKVADAASSIATEVEDYIGFHSPTRKGPGASADKWGTGAINAFIKGLQDGKGILGAASQASADIVSGAFNGIKGFVSGAMKKITVDTRNALSVMSADVKSMLDPLFADINEKYNDFVARSAVFPEKLKKPFEGMYNAFRDTKDKISESLTQLSDDFSSNFEDINKSINDTQEKINQLSKSYTENSGSSNMDLAKRIVDQQKLVSDLQTQVSDKTKEINDATEQDKKDSLQAELNDIQNKLTLESNALRRARDLEREYSDEIREVKKRNRQSDFTNFIEDWNAKREKDLQAFLDEKKKLTAQMNLYEDQRQEIVRLYSESYDKINGYQDIANAVYQNAINQQVLATEAGTNLMKQYFDRVAESVTKVADKINSVKNMKVLSTPIDGTRAAGGAVEAGKSYVVGENGMEIFKPTSSGEIIPNYAITQPNGQVLNLTIQVDTLYGNKDMVRELGREIVRDLARNTSF